MEDPRLQQYRQVAGQMGKRQFPIELPVEGDDDVAQLGHALTELATNLEKNFEELRLLTTITERINSGILLEDVLNYVYDSFQPIIPYQRIGLSLLERGGDVVRAEWARSESPRIRITKGYAAPMAGSSLETIIRTGQPRILNDLEAYLREHPQSDSTRRIVEEGMRSSLTCPLIAMAKPIGFMFFTSTEPETYKNAHVEVFLSIAGQLAVIVEKSRLYQQVIDERERADGLLLNILPAPVAERLKGGESTIAQAASDVTVLFADLVGFTNWSARMSSDDLVQLLNGIFREFDDLAERHGVEKIKTIGDEYMVASGLPVARADHAEAAAELALDMLDVMKRFRTPDGEPIQLRIGMHSGPVVAGVIGKRKFAYDLWGHTVNLASRMQSHGLPDRVHVSPATRKLLGDRYALAPRGTIAIKGAGDLETYILDARS